MIWYAWVIIIYFAVQIGLTIGYIDKRITITRSSAIVTLITNTLLICAVIALASH
jgi:hypothetical protein